MPRVSADHLAARRRQILDAALRCFARDGFHATSMSDVFAESGLSAGAVYRYFPSKTALVRAIAGGVLDGVFADLETAAADPSAPSVGDVILATLAPRLTDGGELSGFLPVVLQIWAEALRDAQMRTFVTDVYERVTQRLAQVIEHDVAVGRFPPDTHPYATGRLLVALVQGYMVQLAVMRDVSTEHIEQAVRACVAGVTTAPPTIPPAPA